MAISLKEEFHSKRAKAMLRSEAFRSDRGLGKVALAAFGLGVFMALHLSLLVYAEFVALAGAARDELAPLRWNCLAQWSLYALALGFFHVMEFMLTAAYRPSNVSYEWWKLHPLIRPVGLALVVMGQFFRVSAMSTAASNFSHRIEYFKRKEHQLVTHGVYRFIRHPSYLGWFWWIVGSQILLANPVCAVGYSLVAWSFFHDRIPYEEQLLLGFFPDEYPAYKARTISGIPFV
uniref:Protein-S-isoprenylcysteine O-methyltransferase n=1 Tax=Phytophthora ramorum TaxID=164328 RepID=H3GPT4_PHYRM